MQFPESQISVIHQLQDGNVRCIGPIGMVNDLLGEDRQVGGMVTPGKLKEIIAHALGLSAKVQTIDVHLRNLREAGLINKEKRGRGAAQMSLADAANLLIAVAGSRFVRDSVETVHRYGKLPFDPKSVTEHGLASRPAPPMPLLDLPSDHSFSKGLGYLLELLASGSFLPESDLQWWSPNGFRVPTPYLLVSLYSPSAAATIQFGVRRSFHVQLAYGSLPTSDPRVAYDLRRYEPEGLMNVAVIPKTALVAIAEAMD